jgi:NDP-sugar pyrophosphorylase family protein
MSPAALKWIPEGRYDMPDFIGDLLACGERVSSYRHTELWLDIGRPDDYGRATELFAENPDVFLPGYRQLRQTERHGGTAALRRHRTADHAGTADSAGAAASLTAEP